MRIGLDVTPLAGPRSGIGMFCQRLVDGLASQTDHEIVGLAFTAKGRKQIAARLPDGVSLGRPIAAKVARLAWLRADSPKAEALARGPLAVVHGSNYVVPPASKAAELVTLHDLGPWLTPELVAPGALELPDLVGRALNRGAHIHVVSRFVADQVQEHLGVASERVHVVHLGLDSGPAAEPEAPGPLAQWDAERPFLLGLGTIEPRKNFPMMVAVLGLLSQSHPELQLVIAGSESTGTSALSDAIAASGLASKVHRLGFVSEANKAWLLSKATVVLSAAIHEGFGLVPLEAMMAETPVVASAGGAVPEICSDGALLVEVNNAEAMATQVDSLLQDEGLRGSLIEAGVKRTRAFSWTAMVEGLSDLYRNIG